MYEIEAHEQIREGMEAIIKKRDNKIADLEETLSVPRQHYKFIERLTTEETIKQKNEIMKRLSISMGIPIESLISKMYEKTAKEAAKKEVDKGLADSGDEANNEDADAGEGKKLDKSASAAPGSSKSAMMAGGIRL